MKKQWVSASKVGRAAFCPKYLEHQCNNEPVSQPAIHARKKGDQSHDAKNKQVARDERCYIASYAFGLNDPRTNELRSFRDKYLQKIWLGRMLVLMYYQFSPYMVRLAKRSPTASTLLNWIATTALHNTRRLQK